MTKWIFEPGHSAAAFAVRHMMVSHMRGLFKNVHGRIAFDPDNPADAAEVEATIHAAGIWTGDDARDAHLRGADFLNVEKYPDIAFRSAEVSCVGGADFRVAGDLTLCGVTRPVVLATHYLGRWQCPYWEGGKDLGPVSRIGFVATTAINRHHFGVSWNAPMDRGGRVVGDEVAITLDVEAIAESDMLRIAGILLGQQ
ncbi:MAG: YceI family protein [Thiobacillus sp.]|nr:YceI family protein [Thiobacillus sp.]